MTNYELGLQFQGARQRRDALWELGIEIAWHIASWTRTKDSEYKLPDLKTVIERHRHQSDQRSLKDQQKALFLQAAEKFGLLVKRVRRKKR